MSLDRSIDSRSLKREVWLQTIGEFMVDDPSIPMTRDVPLKSHLVAR